MAKSGKEDLISIIIPVFNAEKYLRDTIKTLKDQTYANWEAIFIDDKSTDDSALSDSKYTGRIVHFGSYAYL